MTEQEKAINYETLKHIIIVRNLLNKVIREITCRSGEHDKSKLEEPELSIFVEYTPKLFNTTYGSKEYKKFLKEMQPALEHHYDRYRHHPEHFKKIDNMNLIDIIEMLCDWMGATKRHKDGNIMKSIEINKERFWISNQLVNILKNTVIDILG